MNIIVSWKGLLKFVEIYSSNLLQIDTKNLLNAVHLYYNNLVLLRRKVRKLGYLFVQDLQNCKHFSKGKTVVLNFDEEQTLNTEKAKMEHKMTLTAVQYISYYKQRWSIEVAFKHVKTNFDVRNPLRAYKCGDVRCCST